MKEQIHYKNFNIEQNYKAVYYFLKDCGYSENYISNLRKKENSIFVNNKPSNTRTPLQIGDMLRIDSSPNAKTTIMPCILPLDIVYEDTYYLLANKPSGLSCMPNKSHYSLNLAGAILNYMQEKDQNFVVRIINRLDKDTAGLILVAKNSLALQEIKEVQKSYLAVAKGIIDKPITINAPIKTICENGINNIKRVIADDGKEAITHIFPIKQTKEGNTLVELNLQHGRTHQIRLHCSSIGHPLIGDKIYGQEDELISHTALVCYKMSFYHPYLKKVLNFTIDLPTDIKNLITE